MAQDRYWLFDGNDAVGPFYSDELKRQPFFGPESLICPDGSEDANLWRAAKYYLIKGPGLKPDAPREIEAEPTVEPQMNALPSVAPAPAPAPAPFPKKMAAIIAASILVPTLSYLAYRHSKKPAMVPTPAPTANATPATPPAADVNQEAVDFVMKFPVISEGTTLPASTDDIFTAKKWRTPVSVGEALDMKSLYTLGQTASQLLQKQGRGPQSGESEVRKNHDHWDAYSQRYLKANYRLGWTTELAVAGANKFHVTAEARYHREGPRETHDFEADLDRRTLKPLNLDAWYDIDPEGCANWADKNVELGEPVDEAKLAAASPSYSYPLPNRGTHKKMPKGGAPMAANETPKKKKAPAKAPMVVPPVEESDYPDEGASNDENPLIKATSEPLAPPGAKPQKSPAPAKNASASPKPAAPSQLPDKNPSKPVASADNKPAQGEQAQKAKDANDMSVDELEKYLSRGAQKN